MTFRGKKASSTKNANDSERREEATATDKNVNFSQTISKKEISKLAGGAGSGAGIRLS